jgi:dihydroxyacetone kinase-like predicted kinase
VVPALGVVAVLSGDGFEPIFREFGVASVVRGGQGANPSTGELLAAVQAAVGSQILILPNNPNVILAARQVSAMADRPVAVVPTRNAAEGLAALLALDPRLDAAGNVEQMTAAARALQTFVITRAVRDSKIDGLAVRLGQTIALDPDDGLIAVDDDPLRAACTAVAHLRPGYELLTIYYGDGSGLDEAERLAHAVGAGLAGVDVEVVHGGQPHYQYLVAAE